MFYFVIILEICWLTVWYRSRNTNNFITGQVLIYALFFYTMICLPEDLLLTEKPWLRKYYTNSNSHCFNF